MASFSGGEIVGIVLGGVLFILIWAVALGCWAWGDWRSRPIDEAAQETSERVYLKKKRTPSV